MARAMVVSRVCCDWWIARYCSSDSRRVLLCTDAVGTAGGCGGACLQFFVTDSVSVHVDSNNITNNVVCSGGMMGAASCDAPYCSRL